MAVAPGPARLLQIILERPGRVGMHHQTHIFLVDAHAKGVRRADHPHGSRQEFVLHALLLRRCQTGVKMRGRPAFRLQILGRLPRRLPRRPKHDGTARGLGREPIGQQIMKPLELLVTAHRPHFEPQVIPLDATLEQRQLAAGLDPEMLEDLGFDVLLGGGREAGNRRNAAALLFRQFPDEPRGVEVVGPEIMTPLRKAVRFVEHPAADFAERDRFPERPVAQLFGRHI